MDNCENLFDWSRTLLERVGYRMGLDSIVILLTGSKIGQLMSNGTELQNVNVSMQDLYLKPESHKPLQSYWTSGCMPPQHHCVYLLAFKINEQTIYTKFLIHKEFYTLEISDGDLRDTLFLEHWWKPPSGHVDLVEHLKGEERQRDLSNFGGGCLLST